MFLLKASGLPYECWEKGSVFCTGSFDWRMDLNRS